MSRKEIQPVYDANTKIWYSEKEAEFYTTFGRDMLYQARQEGKLTFRLYGKKIIYHREHLDKFIERSTKLCECSDDLRVRQRGRR